MKSIIIFCAHPDDDMLGAGGTVAKYAEDGYDTTVITFSYGETSHIWLQKKITAEMRVKESKRAHRIVGCAKDIFLGLKEGSFPQEVKKRKIKQLIQKIVREKRPEKIFTHSASDPHPDHNSVHKTVLDALENYNVDVYTFDIWNPISVLKRNLPRLYVDISGTMNKKVAAIKQFKSQHKFIFPIIWAVYIKNIKAGIENRCKFAEVFYKIK